MTQTGECIDFEYFYILFITFLLPLITRSICFSRFIHISIGAPGRVHDARVFAHSGLHEIIPAGYQILADSAYPISTSVITPFTNREDLCARDTRRNEIHSSVTMMIERAFGILKKRFAILKFVESTDLSKIKHIILCCVILHNICIDQRDYVEVDLDASLLDQAAEIEDDTIDKRMIRENFFRQLMGDNNN